MQDARRPNSRPEILSARAQATQATAHDQAHPRALWVAGSAELRKAAFDALPAAQILLDPERRVVLATARARRMLALAPSDLGRPIADLRLSSCPPELQAHLDRLLHDPRPVEVKQVRWPHGTQERVLDVQIVPLPLGNGLVGTSLTYSDPGERRRLESRLAEARKELVAADEALWAMAQQLELDLEQQRTVLEQLGEAIAELASATEQLERLDVELLSARQERALLQDELVSQAGERLDACALMDAILTITASRERSNEGSKPEGSVASAP